MHSKKLRGYLDSAAGIGGLLPQAQRLVELREIYRRLVPQALLRSSSVVNYRQQQLVIFAENNAVAAKLRLLTPRLVEAFSRSGVEVTGIRLQVQPREPAPEARRPKRAGLSAAGARSLRALAQSLPASALRDAVAAIACRSTDPEGPAQADANCGDASE